jgi:hypothetical protein
VVRRAHRPGRRERAHHRAVHRHRAARLSHQADVRRASVVVYATRWHRAVRDRPVPGRAAGRRGRADHHAARYPGAAHPQVRIPGKRAPRAAALQPGGRAGRPGVPQRIRVDPRGPAAVQLAGRLPAHRHRQRPRRHHPRRRLGIPGAVGLRPAADHDLRGRRPARRRPARDAAAGGHGGPAAARPTPARRGGRLARHGPGGKAGRPSPHRGDPAGRASLAAVRDPAQPRAGRDRLPRRRHGDPARSDAAGAWRAGSERAAGHDRGQRRGQHRGLDRDHLQPAARAARHAGRGAVPARHQRGHDVPQRAAGASTRTARRR